MANNPITKVSLNITDVVIINDAATQFLKIFRARAAAKGRAQQAVEASLALEASIRDILISVKEALGQE